MADYRIFPWLKHLPGEHDQQAHGKGGSVVEMPPSAPAARFSSLQAALAYAKSTYPRTKFKIGDMPDETASELIDSFDKLAKAFPEVARKIDQVGWPSDKTEAAGVKLRNIWAYVETNSFTGKAQIILNPEYWKDREKFQKSISDSVEAGFHPKGMTDAGAVFTHEFGHHVFEFMQDRVRMSDWVVAHKSEAGEVSGYAKRDAAEFFAETFVAGRHAKGSAVPAVSEQMRRVIATFFKDYRSGKIRHTGYRDERWLHDLQGALSLWQDKAHRLPR